MTHGTAAALSITHGIASPGLNLNLNLKNGSFHRAYPRHIFLDNKLLRSKPKLLGRHLISQHQYQQLSITNDSATPDLMIKEQSVSGTENGIGVASIHHVGLLCENLEKSLKFYQGLLGLTINNARPNDKLPYRGAWLWVGSEMIHLMELPNPDPLTGRPEHGGRDRHTCIAIKDVNQLKSIFDNAEIWPLAILRGGLPSLLIGLASRDSGSVSLDIGLVPYGKFNIPKTWIRMSCFGFGLAGSELVFLRFRSTGSSW